MGDNGKSRDICGHCLRTVWRPDVSGPITIEECTGYRGDRCVLVANSNNLRAMLVHMLRSPGDTMVAAEARRLLGIVDPVFDERCCPLCTAPYVVTSGRVQVHFTYVTDKDPCPASFKHVIDGKLAK